VQQHPFSKSYSRLSAARIEFRYFKDLVTPEALSIARQIPRFPALEDIYSFYIDTCRPDALQLWFGNRSMFRTDASGKVAAEKGGTLLYTLGPEGRVAVILYPATSDLSKPYEDHIYLRIGFYSGYQLHTMFRRNIKDLVSYCHVTSLDGDPTFLEKTRICWLRWTHPFQLKGEFKRAKIFQFAGKASEFTFRSMLIALLKPLAIIIAIIFLIYFGAPHLAEFLRP